jgi:hypothetical protein
MERRGWAEILFPADGIECFSAWHRPVYLGDLDERSFSGASERAMSRYPRAAQGCKHPLSGNLLVPDFPENSENNSEI